MPACMLKSAHALQGAALALTRHGARAGGCGMRRRSGAAARACTIMQRTCKRWRDTLGRSPREEGRPAAAKPQAWRLCLWGVGV